MQKTLNIVNKFEQKILNGQLISFQEAEQLYNDSEQSELLAAADRIRKSFMQDRIDLCTIMNAKSGKCSENCAYCPQSGHYKTGVKEYPLISAEAALKAARENEAEGVHRFSLVTSGKNLEASDLKSLAKIYTTLREKTCLKLCASHGLLTTSQALELKKCGVSRYHHNLETSKSYYPEICSTHDYQERIDTIKNAQAAGLEVCSGGIIGMGESVADRLKMAFELCNLGIKSVPINVLHPVKGTPLENMQLLDADECLRTMAICRFILPDAYIRYAGGRNVLGDKQEIGLHGGVNAMLVGDLLTTVGNDISEDKEMARKQGFKVD